MVSFARSSTLSDWVLGTRDSVVDRTLSDVPLVSCACIASRLPSNFSRDCYERLMVLLG